jgi:shikimate kinase
MGAGKSYLGKELARLLGFAFADLDEVIEASAGMSVATIFEELGEAAFRELEAACLRGFSEQEQTVVATGGGTPCFHQNLDWMNEHGITVYFFANPNLLASRLEAEKDKRPLLARLRPGELEAFIERKLEERAIYYGMCHLQFQVPVLGFDGVDALAGYLRRFF